MSDIWTWLASGGWVMAALLALGLVLFWLILERFVATETRIHALGRSRRDEGVDEPMELPGLRRMGLIRAFIVIAPLLGLLGTVTGMIETFQSILAGGYISEMSNGIRKALLTTQYGLTIAAPALLAEQVLLRRMQKLTHLARATRAGEAEAA